MPQVKWVMLCPMARSGSSHTSETLGQHEGMHSHHGLFNDGPFGRWPADRFLSQDQMSHYSAILDKDYNRIGGEERSGDFLDTYIFTDDPRYNPSQWRCVGFKIQYVHFVHMPDLRDYLIRNTDIRIILNTRRHLVEHAAAEIWCQNGNSRGGRVGEDYGFGDTSSVEVKAADFFGTLSNLCRYREDAIRAFDRPGRRFMEWSMEDMFDAGANLNEENHRNLFTFLGSKPSQPLKPRFAKTPRPKARDYLANYEELRAESKEVRGGVFAKYFEPSYSPYVDKKWPELEDYQLDEIMREKNNDRFRQRRRERLPAE